mgnify:CR=1 FL=1
MVRVEYIDGTSEDIEDIREEKGDAYRYASETQLFHIETRDEIVTIPREFIKSIRYLAV